MDFYSGPEAPTTPGADWFHSETASRAILIEVRLMDGELTVWWRNDDHSIRDLRATGGIRFHRCLDRVTASR
jgi:hypothetical protein